MRIGEKVAALRKSKRLTLQQVHAATGISISHLSALEKGTRKSPSFQYIERLAKLYEVPIAFFADDEVPAPTDVVTASTASFDTETQAFLAKESAGPYLLLARKLAEHHALDENTDVLLRLIADFLHEQKHSYSSS